ncbi:GNAT family N-acetyltransferase [Cellulomonas sp. URHE0023]|uniref:GNAT family N-acetyltransferase n=1 Tax=Cellulomonas sp. URHE0023 TaxID=1380354 RepID=UPI000AAC89F1|nr:GNAT family protein [Cellulomonas sp. URHE0023]
MSTTYTIRIAGLPLDENWSGLTIAPNHDGTSTLTGEIRDQAELHAVLARLHESGATLMELHSAALSPVLAGPLRTARLTLRPAVADDATAIWAYRRLDSVDQWLTGIPSDPDVFRAMFADPARLARTIVVEHGSGARATVVGDLMLRREDGWSQLGMADEARGSQAELGWVLDPAHQGHGYATEAVRELIRYAFDDLGLRRLVANAFHDNDASVRVMERVGMRREVHMVRDSLHRSGRWMDSVAYGLLDDEWRAGHGSVGESR